MKIYLLDRNEEMVDAWSKYFSEKEATIVHADFMEFMDEHSDIDCIVSPANAYGIMDGGYDAAITRYFGNMLKHAVQEKIINEWYGEQPVGTSISVPIPKECYWKENSILIHTPTMRVPEVIIDPRIVYQCMRTTLIEAKKQGVQNIVIPAFGGACGRVNYKTIAKYMYLAYQQVNDPPHQLHWAYAADMTNKLKN